MTASPTAAGPFAGYRVLELGSTVAGPFCGRLFADFGAEVAKVEAASGDTVRSMGRRAKGKSLWAASILRGKTNVSIDLRTEAGQELVRRMVGNIDVLIENFRPGTLERWGLGYDALSAINPGLVMVRISGFGQTGPYSQRAGYGITTEAASGLREIIGEEGRPPPRANIPLTDYITGTYAAFGATMALLAREKTGKGQVVDTALYECAFSFLEHHVPNFGVLGEVAKRAGLRQPGTAPNTLFKTRDGRYIQIAAGNNSTFQRLAEVMGQPELMDDPRFANGVSRGENIDACEAVVAEWVSARDLDEVEPAIIEAGVPASRINNMEDVFADPHFQERDMLIDLEDEDLGRVTVAGVTPKLSATPGSVGWVGRDTGADTADVLADWAGLTDNEIAGLAADGTIYAKPAAPEKTGTDN
jgi:crotonobetainyl-CoA:carnitine CoA-transferase CaiB-like acyl-CoA transferase